MTQHAPFYAPPVARFQKNTKGRDFVMGDVHGAYQLVWEGMKAVQFDKEKDRLFVPGDLINRGEESLRCARFLQMPGVYSTRGNHEDIALDFFKDGPVDQGTLEAVCQIKQFKMLSWMLRHTDEERMAVIEQIRKLPLAIEIETDRGLVGIVHAQVPHGSSWQEFLKDIEAGNSRVIHEALWGRYRIENDDDSGVPGVGRLFVGHTIQHGGMRRFGNVYALDTGAIFGQTGMDAECKLTMVNALMATQALVAQRPPSLIDIRTTDEVPSEPFSPIPKAEEDIAEPETMRML